MTKSRWGYPTVAIRVPIFLRHTLETLIVRIVTHYRPDKSKLNIKIYKLRGCDVVLLGDLLDRYYLVPKLDIPAPKSNEPGVDFLNCTERTNENN